MDNGPNFRHTGRHVFAATFDSNAQSKHGTAAQVCIGRMEVLVDDVPECRENLAGRKVRGKPVNDAKGRLITTGSVAGRQQTTSTTYPRRSFVIDVFGFFLGRNWHETLQDSGGKILVLNLGFFAISEKVD